MRRIVLIGYPFNAGHSVASITYREGLMALTRPWQVIDHGQHHLKEVWKFPPEKARGRRRPVRGTTIEVVQHRPHLVAVLGQTSMIMMHLRQIAIAAFNRRGGPLKGMGMLGRPRCPVCQHIRRQRLGDGVPLNLPRAQARGFREPPCDGVRGGFPPQQCAC